MKLKYRGVAYKYNPTEVTTIEGKVEGKYRGVPWQQKIPQITQVDEPSVSLKYRSVPYRKGAVKLTDARVEPIKIPVTHPEMLPKEQSLGKPKRPKVEH
ncbi:DUF4278 domain-containing protein [Pleurocapsales cyanobacterium LEGE 10410]|nr:DUF4278 domain-containing protein [Pleurocapsales cyanobacterium LEGE 10410]